MLITKFKGFSLVNQYLKYILKTLHRSFQSFPYPRTNPANIYLLKVNNRDTRERYEICSKITIKTLKERQWRRSGVFLVNFEHISHLFLVFLLLVLNMHLLTSCRLTVKSELYNLSDLIYTFHFCKLGIFQVNGKDNPVWMIQKTFSEKIKRVKTLTNLKVIFTKNIYLLYGNVMRVCF